MTSRHATLALFRGRDGRLAAIENHCAHRQVKLSAGRVEGCRLTCRYHGWSYDVDGRLVTVPHELFGNAFPAVRLRSYPVRVRYGLIWVFFGVWIVGGCYALLGASSLAELGAAIPRSSARSGTHRAHPGLL